MGTSQELLGINSTDFSVLTFLNTMGSLPASSLATRLGKNRTTIFSSLKRLKQKGLIYEIPKKGSTFFAVVEKDTIIQNAKSHLQSEEKKFENIVEFAHSLDLKKNSGGIAPKVAFYEGDEGIISLFQKTLTLGGEQKAFLTLEKIPKKILEYLQVDFIASKKEKKVSSQVLIPRSDRAEKYAKLNSTANRKTRFVDKDSPFETEIIICETAVVLIDFREGGIGVFIESESISKTLRSVFDIIWNNASTSYE